MHRYEITDTASAIKNVQRLLGINESGTYGEKTKKATMDVQRRFGIPANGVVDYRTFSKILEQSKYAKSDKMNAWTDGLADFPYDVGDFGRDVSRVIWLLDSVSGLYGGIRALRGSVYSVGVGEAVKWLRGIFGMPSRTDVDEELYIRLKREIFTGKG